MKCPYCSKGDVKYVGGNRKSFPGSHIPQSVNLVCQSKECGIKTWYTIPAYIPNEQINKYFNKKGTA